MRIRRVHQLCFAWLALSVLLLGAMASALKPAVRAAGGDAWVEVCTLSGSKWVNADSSPDLAASHAPDDRRGAGHHCPWCTLQTPALSLPDHAPALRVAPLRNAPIEPPVLAPPPAARAWVLAPSRAPPTIS